MKYDFYFWIYDLNKSNRLDAKYSVQFLWSKEKEIYESLVYFWILDKKISSNWGKYLTYFKSNMQKKIFFRKYLHGSKWKTSESVYRMFNIYVYRMFNCIFSVYYLNILVLSFWRFYDVVFDATAYFWDCFQIDYV